MGFVSTVVAVLVGGFVGLMVLMQVLVRVRARLQTGKDVPPLAGPLGKHVARGRRALVYFHSPGCAACRPMTPRLQALSKRSEGVYLVDVSLDLDTARALKIMATPSFVEIDAGKVVGYHVGAAPSAVLERFAG
jgi:thioredoxin 1